MHSAAIAFVSVAIGYAAATLYAPAAEADDSAKIIDALQALVRAEEKQSDSLRRIAESAGKCAR